VRGWFPVMALCGRWFSGLDENRCMADLRHALVSVRTRHDEFGNVIDMPNLSPDQISRHTE